MNDKTVHERDIAPQPRDDYSRPDLRPVEHLLDRARVYARQFNRWNLDTWPDLKNNQGFDKIWDLPDEQRFACEKVYGEGRDMAHDLSVRLTDFSSVELHPTFKSFVDSLEQYLDSWTPVLRSKVESAEALLPNMPFRIWAVERMIEVAHQQFAVVDALKNWIQMAKHSLLYRQEAGDITAMSSPGVEVHVGDKYTSNVSTSNVGAIATGPGSTAHGAVSHTVLSQADHKQQLTEAQHALLKDQDALEDLGAGIYEALSQFLRLAREIQVEQRSMADIQLLMKDTLDTVWAEQKAKGLRPPPLPKTLEVVKALTSNPTMAAVVKHVLENPPT